MAEQAEGILRDYFELVAEANPGVRELLFTSGKKLSISAVSCGVRLGLVETHPFNWENLDEPEMESLIKKNRPLLLTSWGKKQLGWNNSQTSLMEWLYLWSSKRSPKYLLLISLEVYGLSPTNPKTLDIDHGILRLSEQVFTSWKKSKENARLKALALLAGAPRILCCEEALSHIERQPPVKWLQVIEFVGSYWSQLGCNEYESDLGPEDPVLLQVNGTQVSLYPNLRGPGETPAMAIARQLRPHFPQGIVTVNGEEVVLTCKKGKVTSQGVIRVSG